MFNKLVFASIIALSSLTAQTVSARSIMVQTSPVVFSIDKRLKSADLGDINEYHFELHRDGTWSYVETKSQAIVKRGSGKLSRAKVQKIEGLLKGTWTTTHADITCMAFSPFQELYSVNGKLVFTDEMCGSERLDAGPSKRLENIMTIVRPLIASMVK